MPAAFNFSNDSRTVEYASCVCQATSSIEGHISTSRAARSVVRIAKRTYFSREGRSQFQTASSRVHHAALELTLDASCGGE